MMKLIAIANIVAWAGFWAFGYLALSGDSMGSTQTIVAGLLAVFGGFLGIFTYLKLVRHTEASGYAKKPNRVTPKDEYDPLDEGVA
jgi:hypothetical protein